MILTDIPNWIVIFTLMTIAIGFYSDVKKPGWDDKLSLAATAVTCFSLLIYTLVERGGLIPVGMLCLPFTLMGALYCLGLPPYRGKGKAELQHRAVNIALCVVAGLFGCLRDQPRLDYSFSRKLDGVILQVLHEPWLAFLLIPMIGILAAWRLVQNPGRRDKTALAASEIGCLSAMLGGPVLLLLPLCGIVSIACIIFPPPLDKGATGMAFRLACVFGLAIAAWSYGVTLPAI